MAAIIRFDLDISKMTVQGGGCTTVVMQNEIQIHQQKRRNMNKHNLCLCRPAVLGSRNFAICFLSQLFYSHFDIVKYEDSIVSILFDDTMTYTNIDDEIYR